MPEAAHPALLLLVVAGVLTIAPAASAQEPVSLAWNAPAGCPSGDSVLADVKAILGGPTPHRVQARADVTQLAPDHWSVHVTTDVDGTQGERQLDADSCTSLAKATALILAWAVDPVKARAALAASQPAPPPAAPATPEPVPARSIERTPPPPPPAPSSSPPIAAIVAVSGMGDVGTLPSPGGAVELTLGALVGPFRFELSGADWLTQQARNSARNGDEFAADIHLLQGSLRGCFRWRPVTRFELDPCAGAALVAASSPGQSSASAFVPRSGSGDWIVAHADVLAAWRILAPLALRASVGAEATPAPPQFTVTTSQGDVVLHKPGVYGATATLGVEAHFP